MSQKVHDHFAKQYIAYLLDEKGKVDISYEILGTSFQVDVAFSPDDTADFQAMGLLGKIASQTGFLEVFWNQPQTQEIRICLTKLFLTYNNLYNKAKNENKSIEEETLPQLWIITTSASDKLRQSFGATRQAHWCQGVYFLNDGLKTAIVAINQLPSTPETLWLRLLGKETVRQQAIQELIALPQENVLRNPVLKLVYNYLKRIKGKSQQTNEEKELIMELSPAYYQWERETIQQGMRQMQRLFIENLLKLRFGELDEILTSLIEPLLELPPEESARLLLQSSREDLLKKLIKD
jgi:hypothetical protein